VKERVTVALRRAVIARAQGRCEYCGMPDAETLLPHEPDHVIARQHGGQTKLDNLAYTCFQCNRYKGPNIASLDPATGALTALFHPRTVRWTDHFCLRGAAIEPLTAIGRATSALLRLNDAERVTIRANLLARGRYRSPGG
jgi:HNH endonuclease